MESFLFVNACIRENDSRTLKLAKRFLSLVSDKYETEEINLCRSELTPVDSDLYAYHQSIGFKEDAKELAQKFADANKIVVAAPFWDMSFPSALKVFFERISIFGITFRTLPDGNTVGSCKADRLLYITTRGMDLKTGDPLEQGTPYIKALCYLWGIKDFDCISVSGTDVLTAEESEKRMSEALKEAERFADGF